MFIGLLLPPPSPLTQVLLVKDVWASVRAEAIRTVTKCLSLVKDLPSRLVWRGGKREGGTDGFSELNYRIRTSKVDIQSEMMFQGDLHQVRLFPAD